MRHISYFVAGQNVRRNHKRPDKWLVWPVMSGRYFAHCLCGLPQCAGALDGTFMQIKKSSEFGDSYYCYSHRRGLVVSDNGCHSMVWGFKPQWRHWIMKLVCISFSCFSSFVHETKTRFSRWGVSVVWRTARWQWRSVLSWWSLISTGRAVPSSRSP